MEAMSTSSRVADLEGTVRNFRLVPPFTPPQLKDLQGRWVSPIGFLNVVGSEVRDASGSVGYLRTDPLSQSLQLLFEDAGWRALTVEPGEIFWDNGDIWTRVTSSPPGFSYGPPPPLAPTLRHGFRGVANHGNSMEMERPWLDVHGTVSAAGRLLEGLTMPKLWEPISANQSGAIASWFASKDVPGGIVGHTVTETQMAPAISSSMRSMAHNESVPSYDDDGVLRLGAVHARLDLLCSAMPALQARLRSLVAEDTGMPIPPDRLRHTEVVRSPPGPGASILGLRPNCATGVVHPGVQSPPNARPAFDQHNWFQKRPQLNIAYSTENRMRAAALVLEGRSESVLQGNSDSHERQGNVRPVGRSCRPPTAAWEGMATRAPGLTATSPSSGLSHSPCCLERETDARRTWYYAGGNYTISDAGRDHMHFIDRHDDGRELVGVLKPSGTGWHQGLVLSGDGSQFGMIRVRHSREDMGMVSHFRKSSDGRWGSEIIAC